VAEEKVMPWSDFPGALLGLLSGANIGKMVVKAP
jgi:NADPH-dependent curcumin reductase CurA